MGQKKVSKRKYDNPKLGKNKVEIEKDMRVPDNAKVLIMKAPLFINLYILIFYIFSCSSNNYNS